MSMKQLRSMGQCRNGSREKQRPALGTDYSVIQIHNMLRLSLMQLRGADLVGWASGPWGAGPRPHPKQDLKVTKLELPRPVGR